MPNGLPLSIQRRQVRSRDEATLSRDYSSAEAKLALMTSDHSESL
jgi:hypothetical protein